MKNVRDPTSKNAKPYKVSYGPKKTLHVPGEQTRSLIRQTYDAYQKATEAGARGDQDAQRAFAERAIAASLILQSTPKKAMTKELRALVNEHDESIRAIADEMIRATNSNIRQSNSRTAQAPQPAQPPKPTKASAPKVAKAAMPSAAALLSSIDIDSQFLPPPSAAQSPINADALSLRRQMRRSLAQSLTQNSAAKPQKNKLRLDGDAITQAIGRVADAQGQAQAFRVSLVTPPHEAYDLLVGSSLDAGSEAKRRPALVLQEDGSRLPCDIEELRLAPMRDDQFVKGSVNRFGQMRNEQVHTLGSAQQAYEKLQLLGDGKQTFGATVIDDKFYILTAPVDGNTLARMTLGMPAQMRPTFARLALADLVASYQRMHARGFVHGDGKLEHALLSYESEQVMAHGLSRASQLGPSGVTTQPSAVSYLSPELYGAVPEQCVGFGPQHDVWTLAISAMRLLAGDVADHQALRDPHALVQLRGMLFERLHLGDNTMIPLERIAALVAQGVPHMAAIERMMLRDQTLAHFVLWRMLDINPQTRATLGECALVLETLKAPHLAEKHTIITQQRAQYGGNWTAFAKLQVAADLVEGNTLATK